MPVAAPEVARRIAGIDDLRRETLLHIGPLIDDWERWLEAAGAPHLEGRENHRFNTYILTLDLARRGQGVACAHSFLVEDMIRSGALVPPFETAVPAREGYYLLGPRHGETNRAARAFCDWLRAQFVPPSDQRIS
jgi:LysR family glycine cleavage system transcriptional activator